MLNQDAVSFERGVNDAVRRIILIAYISNIPRVPVSVNGLIAFRKLCEKRPNQPILTIINSNRDETRSGWWNLSLSRW